MGHKNKPAGIPIEQHDVKERQDAADWIKTREAWFAALASRGLKKIQLSEIEFEMWWKEKLGKV